MELSQGSYLIYQLDGMGGVTHDNSTAEMELSQGSYLIYYNTRLLSNLQTGRSGRGHTR